MAQPEAGWPARHLSGYERIQRQFRHYHDHGNCLILPASLSKNEPSTLSEYVAVAGFYGQDDQWNALSFSWKQALGRRKALRMKTLRIDSKPQRAKCLLD